MQQTHTNSTTNWPDLSVDQAAWEMAKLQLGSSASVSEIAQRAQSLKTSLLALGEDDMERARR